MKIKLFLKKFFRIKTIIFSLLIIVLLSIISIIFADKKIKSQSKNYLYNDVLEIPYNKVGLVLGTSKFLQNGQVNLYYQYRIDAAVTLYKAGKISYIVVSGDNSRKDYDEPTQMKADLAAGGVPENVIYIDYAGFRTWDSVVRIKEIFSQSNFTIISQRFHNERAVYLAHRYGLNAVAFNAKDVSKYYGFKTNLREKLARVKVFVDLLTNKKPRFLGEKVEIVNQSLVKFEKQYITGNFYNKKDIDTIETFLFSTTKNIKIDFVPNNELWEWDEVMEWYNKNGIDLFLKSKTDTVNLGTAEGLLYMQDLGDVNFDGKNEIAIVADWVDFSNVNSLKIYTICNDKFTLLKSFTINEMWFYGSDDLPVSDFWVQKNGKWYYKDYFDWSLEDEEVTPMQPLKLDKCK